MSKEDIIKAINELSLSIHTTAKEKGWWDGERNPGELLALIHSEVSECLEAFREGIKETDKKIGITNVEEELADTIIRVLDFGQSLGYDMGEAILKKAEYNKSRPFRHGGKKF